MSVKARLTTSKSPPTPIRKILDSGEIKDAQRIAVLLRLANCPPPANGIRHRRLHCREGRQRETQTRACAGRGGAGPSRPGAARGNRRKFLVAIGGDRKRGLWGWAGVSNKFKQNLDVIRAPGKTPNPELVRDLDQRYLQARYYITWCRMQHGIAQSGDVKNRKRQQILKNAIRELLDLAMTYGVIEGKQFEDAQTRRKVDARQRFDKLYHDVQVAMGREIPVALTWAVPQPKQRSSPSNRRRAQTAGRLPSPRKPMTQRRKKLRNRVPDSPRSPASSLPS